MKETIYTIPINEAFSAREGCPFCRLYKTVENNSLEYALGGAMMEVRERTKSNEFGFCSRHFDGLRERKNKLSLGLMTESHLSDLIEDLFREDILNGKIFKNPKISPEKFSKRVAARSSGCYVCDRISGIMKHYYTNAVYMWKNDEDFRKTVLKQEYFCLPHLSLFIDAGRRSLTRKTFGIFSGNVMSVSARYADMLACDNKGFCQCFDHRNAGKPMSDAQKSSIEKTGLFINGQEHTR